MCISKLDNLLYHEKSIQLGNVGYDKNFDNCDYISYEDCPGLSCSDKDLAVIQLNLRGLINKQSNLSNLITSCCTNKKIDVVILCETWINKDIKHLIKVPGYDYIGIERTNKKGGGVGLLIAKELHYKPLNQMNKITDHLECYFVEITIKGRNILCGSMYRPPNTNVKAFHSDITEILEHIKRETHKDCIIGMDHNLDFIKHTQHQYTSKFIETMLEYCMFLCITRPTRITKTSATLIDNIFVSTRIHDQTKSCVITHDISDHFPSMVFVGNILAKRREPKKIITRELKDCKLASLNDNLCSINWPTLLSKKIS